MLTSGLEDLETYILSFCSPRNELEKQKQLEALRIEEAR